MFRLKYVIAGFAALVIGTTVHELTHVFVGRAVSGEWPIYEIVQVTQVVPFASDFQRVVVTVAGPLVELVWIGLVGGAAIVTRGRRATFLAAAFGMLAIRAWAVLQVWVDAARSAPGGGRVELRPGKGRFDIRWERVPGAAPDECDQRAADTCAAGGGDLPGASGRRPAMREYGGCCPGPAGCGACDVCAADVEGISGFVLRRHWCGSDRRLFVASPHVINSDQHPPRGGSGSRPGMWVAETRSDNRQRFSRQSRVPAGQPSRELARKSTILPAPSIVSGLAASDHSRFHRLPSQVRTDRQEQAERTLHRRAGP